MSGVEIEYMIVKDYCEKYELDTIEIYETVKHICAEVYKK